MKTTNRPLPSRLLLALLAAGVVGGAGAGAVTAMQARAEPAPSLAAAPAVGTVAPPNFAQITREYGPAVVNISVTGTTKVSASDDPFEQFFGQFPGMAVPRMQREVPVRGEGSGFIVSRDGVILTNAHVVKDASEVTVKLTDRREFRAKVLGSDPQTDVAVIKIDAADLPVVKIGRVEDLSVGEWVLAIGSPFGLENTATAGIVSAKGRSLPDDTSVPFIQTDVAVNPGNSGGPLLNLNGEVVGINSQIISRSGGFMGISLAIPIDEAMRVADQLRATGKVTRGRIGVQISEVGKDVAEAIGLPRAEGALVSNVEADGPAADAGVKPGDVITSFHGEAIKRWSDLPRIVGETKPGTRADMEVWRRGKTVTLSVKVGELTSTAAAADAQQEAVPEQTGNALGLGVVDVPAEVQRKLGIKGGVQVRVADGAAAMAGLRPGDIVLAINNTDVTGASQFQDLVKRLPKGKAAGLLVRRGDQTQWVAVEPSK